ncbi:MAG TPA: hypothetical protein VK961_09500 [Chthoniobacter sp.]|nr:hypothetical protein [Chthoniobacter sp.]
MNITKLFLLSSVGLAAFAFTPTAKADDHHHRHHGDHHDHDGDHHHGDYHHYDRPYYYTTRPDVIYTNPSYGYYRGNSDVVISVGGHRTYRYHR